MKTNCKALILLLLLAGCNKDNVKTPDTETQTPPVTPPVTTTPGTWVNVWQLSAVTLNNINQPLTPLQSSFKMTINSDGRYADSDGVTGNWSNPTSDSLKINQTNLPTPISIRFKIRLQTTTTLALSQTSNDKSIELTYAAK